MLIEVWGEGGGELEVCGGLHSQAEEGGDLGLLATEGWWVEVGGMVLMGLGRSAMVERMSRMSGL